MPYAIIPINNFPALMQPYKVVNQIFKQGENHEELERLPFVMLEDDFNPEQMQEITAVSGVLFTDSNDYHDWKNQQ